MHWDPPYSRWSTNHTRCQVVLKTEPNPNTAVRIRKLAPPPRLAVLRHCTVERRNSVVCPGQRRRSVDTYGQGGRLFQRGRGPRTRQSRARRRAAAAVNTRAHRWGVHAPARRRTPRRLPKRMRGRQTDEQGEAGSVHVCREKAYGSQLPHELFFSIGGGGVGEELPHEPVFCIGDGEAGLEGCNQRTCLRFPTRLFSV